MTIHGTIRNGTIVLDDPASLPEGSRVACILVAEPPDESSPKTDSKPMHADLLKFAGVIKGGPDDASENLDHYLYGLPKK